MAKTEPITVSSHVSRDFLQNSAYFNTLPKVVWEYVSNSLDAGMENGLVVAIDISSNEVTISDNGRGMSRNELHNFFQMHGVNQQRKHGKSVRGRFGTGKSAAFGLANYLRIDTTQGGLRNTVELRRNDIESASDGAPFPVRDIVANQLTSDSNGTIVTVREFNIKRPDIDKVIAYVEHHLARFRVRAHVTINQHECKFTETPFSEQIEIPAPEDVVQHIGNVNLIIKVSTVPLDEETNGIDILANGIWHGTTLAGIEKRERASHIFGEIDVPVLEDGEWLIPAFDNTRNNTLNPQNPVVAVLLGWISEELEIIRKQLVDNERQRRKSDEAKQLAKEAARIAEILNEDFQQIELQLELTRQVAKRSGGTRVNEKSDTVGELWPGDGNEPTLWQQSGPEHTDGHRGSSSTRGETPRPGPSLIPGSDPGSRKNTSEGSRKQRRGVFSIDYSNDGTGFPRSRYDNSSKTIYINLDHPQISTALQASSGRISDPQFRQICYEVAAVEYALAIPNEKLERQELYEADEALFDVKDVLNRVTRRLTQALYD